MKTMVSKVRHLHFAIYVLCDSGQVADFSESVSSMKSGHRLERAQCHSEPASLGVC